MKMRMEKTISGGGNKWKRRTKMHMCVKGMEGN